MIHRFSHLILFSLHPIFSILWQKLSKILPRFLAFEMTNTALLILRPSILMLEIPVDWSFSSSLVFSWLGCIAAEQQVISRHQIKSTWHIPNLFFIKASFHYCKNPDDVIRGQWMKVEPILNIRLSILDEYKFLDQLEQKHTWTNCPT